MHNVRPHRARSARPTPRSDATAEQARAHVAHFRRLREHAEGEARRYGQIEAQWQAYLEAKESGQR